MSCWEVFVFAFKDLDKMFMDFTVSQRPRMAQQIVPRGLVNAVDGEDVDFQIRYSPPAVGKNGKVQIPPLIDWLIDWLMDGWMYVWMDGLLHWLIDWLACCCGFTLVSCVSSGSLYVVHGRNCRGGQRWWWVDFGGWSWSDDQVEWQCLCTL